MHKIVPFLLPLAWMLPLAAAEVRFDPEVRASTIGPFVDAQTLAVAHVDVTRMNAERLAAAFTDFANLTPEKAPTFKQATQHWITDFTKAGGKELYVVASLDDLPRHLTVVVPIEGHADARVLARLLEGLKSTELAQSVPLLLNFETIEQVDGAIVAGSKAALARFRGGKPAPRPEVARAFAAGGDTVAQLLLLPSAQLRHIIEEIIPTLPKTVGDGPSTVVTRGFQWAAIGADGPPKTALHIVLQARDAAAAQSLSALLPKVYQVLGQDKELQRVVPYADKILAVLTPQVSGDRLTLTFDPGDRDTARLLLTLGSVVTQIVARDHCAENLRRLALALHTYHDVHGSFPAEANYDSQGKPLLSWRVHILPYLGEETLYKEFHLNEPWDSEHNQSLSARMPAVYRCPSMPAQPRNKTTYVAPVHDLAIFTGGPEGVPIKEIKDGTSLTILLVDADNDHAVIWTKPEDLKLDLQDLRQGLFGHHPGLSVVLFADGSVHFLPETIGKETLRALFTRNGGESVVVP